MTHLMKRKYQKSANKQIAITVYFIKEVLKIENVITFPADTKYANYIGATISGIPMLNVHVQTTDSLKYGAKDLYERTRNIEFLKEYMKNHSCYVIGDFNNGLYNTQNHCFELVSEDIPEDSCYKVLRCSEQYMQLLNNGEYSDLLCVNGKETNTFNPPGKSIYTPIDYVLTNVKDNEHTCIVKDNIYFSDHYPILLDIIDN